MYLSFKTTDFHGLTLQENLTVAKALGLGAYTQSTSSTAPEDSWNLKQQYGKQPFDQKYIFNTFIVCPGTLKQLGPAAGQASHGISMLQQTRRKATADGVAG